MVCYYHETKTGWLILELEGTSGIENGITGIGIGIRWNYWNLNLNSLELLELELEFVEITGI